MAEFDFWSAVGINLLVDFLRYFIAAGIFFLVFYVIFKKYFEPKRIQQDRKPKIKRMRREFLFSLFTVLIFAGHGLFITWAKLNGSTEIYDDIADYGWWYFVLSIALYIIVHDSYFYWSHRFMHMRAVYRYFHLEHHRSVNPSPWAAYAFHPLEAVVEAAIFPILVFTIPAHPSALFVFLVHMIVRNVIGHLGYEVYPKGFTKRRFWRHLCTATHHDMHHRNGEGNYGLYFTWWDRLMGTEVKDYHDTFEKVASRCVASHAPFESEVVLEKSKS